MGAAEAAPIRLLFVMLVTRIDLEALAIIGHRDLTLDRRERPESAERAAKLVTAHIVERPHVLGLKAQMRLRDEGLAVRPNESEVLDRVGNIPAMVAVLPFTATAEAAHRWGGATFVLGGKAHLVRPAAAFRAIGVHFAVDFVTNEVFANQAGNHAAPATMRVRIAHLAVEENVGFAGNAKFGMPFPEIAELGVPAWILVLEPLEVLFGLGFDAPEIHRPSDREELRSLVDVVLLDDPVPGGGDVVVMDLDAVLLERQHVGPIIIFVNPAMPKFGIGFLVLVAVGRAVFDEGPDRGIDNRVILPEGIFQIAFQQLMVRRIIDH